MFDSYTSDGINQFYFCLKNGFENLQPQQGENCPLDEYGLSMIAVSVDSDGALNTCTCRWNHDNGGNDSIMNTKEISQVIGQNFYEVFKPNNKFKEKVEMCLQKIASGENPENAFDYYSSYLPGGYYEIMVNNKYNILLPNRQFFSKTWFDSIGYRNEGWIHVKLGGKHNFINLHGNYLLDKWVDNATSFSKGFAVIKDGQQSYLIKPDGNLISPVGFDEFIGSVQEEGIIARVFKDELYYFLDQNGNYILITYDNSLNWRDDNIAAYNQESIRHNNSHPSN